MDDQAVGRRLSELEKDVEELKAVVGKSDKRNARLYTLGRFENDPIYDEAMRLGRKCRRRQPKC